MAENRWLVRLSAAAEHDFIAILRWTPDTFGEQQAHTYRDTLLAALSALTGGPGIPGSRARDDIWPGLRTLHVARRGRRGRHFVMYRVSGARAVDVLLILHQVMDLPRHLPPADPEPSP